MKTQSKTPMKGFKKPMSNHSIGREKQKVHNNIMRIMANKIRRLKKQRKIYKLSELLGFKFNQRRNH